MPTPGYTPVTVDRRKGKRGMHKPAGIFAGTRGTIRTDDSGEIFTVQPASPGSIVAANRGYRWVCLSPEGRLIFIPFRDFIPCEPEKPQI